MGTNLANGFDGWAVSPPGSENGQAEIYKKYCGRVRRKGGGVRAGA